MLRIKIGVLDTVTLIQDLKFLRVRNMVVNKSLKPREILHDIV